VKTASQRHDNVRHRFRAFMPVQTLRQLGLGLFLFLISFSLLSVYTYTRAGGGVRVSAAVPARLNFQARLLNSGGAIVPDTNYSVEFNLYTASSGGSSVWSETHGTVPVKSGYLSVYLGDVDNDLDTLDWSQQYWLTMNVNGDGEMNPRLRLTSVPYAFRAGQADGITDGAGTLVANEIAQLAPSSIQAVNTALAALRINQQGAGLLAQFQGAGSDVFTIANNGDIQSDGDATFEGGSLNLGTASQSGGVVLSDGSSHTATIQPLALGQNTVYNLPDPGGATATICLSTGNCSGTGDISNGGNSFGSTITIGTNDGNSLAFETSGVTKLTLDTSGTLDLLSGDLEINGTSVLTNGRAIQNITTLNMSGAISAATATNTINGLVINSGSLSSVGDIAGNGALTLSSGGSGALTLDSASNTLVLSDSTLQYSGSGLTLDVNNAGLSTFNLVNTNGSNLANLDVEGAIFAGNGNALQVNADGDITSVFTALDGTSTANGASGGSTSTTLILNNAANFDVGNYVQMNSANCGGTGINPCYAKITAKATNTLTISPALRWTNGSTVNEYHIPEIGGSDTASTLANRYGRGYFISGIAAGNGTTFYNEGSIETSLTSFDLLNTVVTALNIGGEASTLNIGSSGGTVNILGNLATSGSNTITTGGGLVVSSGGATITGGIDNNSGGLTEVGAVSGVTTLALSGAITGATSTNTINGLVINSGALSSVTGITFTSGALNLNNGGITNAGSIAGATTINANGAISGATSTDTINGLVINSGALSSITTINASGAITAATSSDTINGLVINAGALTSVASITGGNGLTVASGGSGALTLDSASNTLVLAANDTTIQRTASGALNFELNNAAATSFVLNNTGAGAAGLVLTDGDLATGGTPTIRLTNAGALQNISTLGLSGAITGATATNTINGLIINSGALSAITGFTQTSGNFSMSGTGTFGTGTGAVSLNGNTSITNGNTFTVGTGLSSLGGALTVTGLTTLNGNLTMQAGDTFTFNSDAITDLTGNGLALSTGVLTLDVTTAGTVAGTGSNSGLIVAADGLSLIRGCANNQILKWATGGGGAWNCAADASDARLKTNIEDVENNMLSKIRQVRIVQFDFDCSHEAFQSMHCDTDHQRGVLAQEIAVLFPELVREVNDHLEVDYRGLTMYNIKATSELADKVDNLGINQSQPSAEVATGGTLRLDSEGVLQNITGLQMIGGGASVIGGLDNNSGGISEAGSISGATTIDAQKITLNSSGTDNMLELKKDGQGVFTVFHNGALELRLDANNTFAVKNGSNEDVFSINTNGGLVQIGSATADEKTMLLVLDSKSTEGDPTGVNGAQYYNSVSGKFRCYQNDKWQDCLPAANTEYVLSAQTHSWRQFAGEAEITGSPRTWIDLTTAREFRLLTTVTAPGATGTVCRLQYTTDESGNNWMNLAWAGDDGVLVDATGSIKGNWIRVSPGAQSEVLVRVMCRSTTISSGAPVINGIRIQVR
jgi:hypothetical protein